MADVKISALTETATSAPADSIPIVQGGVTKRIHPGPAGGLDADTVSGYGIGTTAKSVVGDAIDAIREGGLYCTSGVPTNPPWAGENIYLLHLNQGTNYSVQVAFRFSGSTTSDVATRTRVNSTWYSWNIGWSTANDGLGGQPPAPKPRVDPGSKEIATFVHVALGASINVYPSGATASGTWAYNIRQWTVGTVLVNEFSGVAAGNTLLFATGTGFATGWAWRIGT